MHNLAAKVDEYARGMISGTGSSLFEELGLYYIGPVDGHNLDDLISILKEVKITKTTGPVLIHLITEKGRGYPYAEKAADKYHGNIHFFPKRQLSTRVHYYSLNYFLKLNPLLYGNNLFADDAIEGKLNVFNAVKKISFMSSAYMLNLDKVNER